jgi:cytochrome P450
MLVKQMVGLSGRTQRGKPVVNENSSRVSDLPSFPMQRDLKCPFNPPPDLKRLQSEAPITKVRIWNGQTPWLVTRYDDVRFVLKDPRFSVVPTRPGWPPMSAGQAATRRDLKPNIFSLDNPEHNDYRKMMSGDFRIAKIETLRPRVQAIVEAALDEVLAGTPPLDLWTHFALKVPSLVICEMLGVPYSDHELFQDRSEKLVSTTSSDQDIATALKDIQRLLENLARAKQAAPTDDIISRMAVQYARTGVLTPAEIADMCVMLLIAGHDTTSNMICLSTVLFLSHPEQLEEFRNGDEALVANAVEECLRYINVPHLGRRRVALEDVELGGVLIRAGEGVIAGTMIGDRDERAFPSPDEFNIHREARHMLAFGYGVHQCLGQPLARLELQVALTALFRRIPTLKLAVPQDQLPFDYEALVYGLHELMVTW